MKVAMQHIGQHDLTTSLQGQPSHRPPQPGSMDSHIDLRYADPTQVEVVLTRYHDLPSKATDHRPLERQYKVLQIPPATSGDTD